MEPVVCLDCGFILGAYYDLFLYMKEILISSNPNKIHIDKKFIDPESQVILISIFDILKINKYCCRSQLISCLNMHDLEL